jgi:hypothetical protein
MERVLTVVGERVNLVQSTVLVVRVALGNVKHGRDRAVVSRLVVLISSSESKAESRDGSGSAGRTEGRYCSHSMSFLLKLGGRSRVPEQHAGRPVRATRRPHFGSPAALHKRDTTSECNENPLQANV